MTKQFNTQRTNPMFFSPIHTPSSWFTSSNNKEPKMLIFDSLDTVKRMKRLNAKIKQECRGNPDQQSIKKIGGKCKEFVPLTTRCAGSLEKSSFEAKANRMNNKIKRVDSFVYKNEKNMSSSSSMLNGKTPRRHYLYKRFDDTIFLIGEAYLYYSPWISWRDVSFKSEANSLERLYQRSLADDHRNVRYHKFSNLQALRDSDANAYTRMDNKNVYLLHGTTPVSYSEFDAVTSDDLDILLAGNHVEHVSLGTLRDMCIRNSWAEKSEEIVICEEMDKHFNAYFINAEISLLNNYKKYAKKIKLDPVESKNQKIRVWPEMCIKAASQIEAKDMLTVERIYVGQAIQNKLWRNRKILSKISNYKFQPAITFVSGFGSSHKTRPESQWIGDLGSIPIYSSKNIAKNETFVTSTRNRAWEGEVYAIEFLLDL